jgi:hypothetical protein
MDRRSRHWAEPRLAQAANQLEKAISLNAAPKRTGALPRSTPRSAVVTRVRGNGRYMRSIDFRSYAGPPGSDS